MTKPTTKAQNDDPKHNEFRVRRPHLFWWSLTLGGLLLIGSMGFSGAFYFWIQQTFGIDPGRWAMAALFFLIIAIHAFEAYQAYITARKLPAPSMALRRKNAFDWWLQTFIVGVFSLRLLMALRRKHKEHSQVAKASGSENQ